MSFSSSRKARPGEPGACVRASNDKVFTLAKERFPEVGHRVPEHPRPQRGLRSTDESEAVSPAGRFDQPQLNQGRFQAIFVAVLAGRRLSDVGADEAGNVSPNSGGRRAGPLQFLSEFLYALDQRLAFKGNGRVIVKSPKPCRLGFPAAQVPVDQPCSGRVFHVGIDSPVAEYETP